MFDIKDDVADTLGRLWEIEAARWPAPNPWHDLDLADEAREDAEVHYARTAW